METFIQKFLVVVLVVILCFCTGNKQPQVSLDKVALQLKWIHQAQFAGFYVAHDKGFYSDEHIDVTFIEGGSQVDIAAPLISGAAQFTVLSPEDILIKQSEKIPVTAIATIYQRNAVVYLSQADSWIAPPPGISWEKKWLL